MHGTDQISVIKQWVQAVNGQDIGEAEHLCAEDIEIVGPKGSAKGRHVLREWIARAGIRLETQRWFGSGRDIVVTQHATWGDPEPSDSQSTVLVSTHFTINSGTVCRVARFDSLQAALEDAGLSEQDEVRL